jgi:CRISPR-associated protein Cas2
MKPLSEYRGMWTFALFDLPVTTKAARKRYAAFRHYLLKEGFSMMQFSVYVRYNGTEESTQAMRRRVRAEIPPNGHVRLLSVTDHQFGKMEIYYGKKPQEPEEPPRQTLLF